MGRVKKGLNCSIEGCKNKSVRSFSIMKITKPLEAVGLNVKVSRSRRVLLCEKHYKKVKKELKKSEKYEKIRFGGQIRATRASGV